MARRGNSPVPSTPVTPTEVTQPDTNVQEDNVSENTPTPEVEGEATEATPVETPAPEVEADLTDFNAAVASAIEERDESTGDIDNAHSEAVTKAYRAIETPKGKAAARKFIEDSMKEAMNDMDLSRARAYLNIQKGSLTAGSSGGSGTPRAPRPPADPTEAFVQKVGGLRLALNLAQHEIPEGVAEDWTDKVKAVVTEQTDAGLAYLAWATSEAEDKGDAPEAPAWVIGAVKLALGKSAKVGSTPRAGATSSYTGERRDIAKHILAAFENKASGDFLTIAEIRNAHSEEYGTDLPSAGAVSARLFPKSGKFTVEGIVPGTNETGKRGARKA